MTSLTVVCEECNTEFTVYRLGIDLVRDDIERTYFLCPACKKEFTCFYTNEGIRRLQNLMQSLVGKEGKKNVRLRLDLKKRIGVGMDRLRQEVEG